VRAYLDLDETALKAAAASADVATSPVPRDDPHPGGLTSTTTQNQGGTKPMSDATVVDLSLFVLRLSLGVVLLAHGWNHVFGGGKISGTAGWFESLGMRPGLLHAWTASMTEVTCGLLLLLGLLTPLACAGVVGTMSVAMITAHLRNGFFIFRPGEGYEYVLTLTLAALALSGAGAGGWSLDHIVGWFAPPGWVGPAIATAAGFGGAATILGACWRPSRVRQGWSPDASGMVEATDGGMNRPYE